MASLHNKAFGLVLRDLRRQKKMSQEALGFEASLSRYYISILETGKGSPTLDTIETLRRVLGISLVDFARLIEETMSSHKNEN